MQIKLIYFYIIWAIVQFGCKTETPVKEKEILVNFEQGAKIKLSSICPGLEYTYLESNELNLIASVDKTIYTQGKFYFLDKKLMKMFIYSKNGKLLSSMDKKGRGPGEYNYLNDFLVDTINQTIELLDDGNQKIIKTDLNFNYINERKKPGYLSIFAKLDSNIYIYFAQNYINPKLFKENESQNIVIIDSEENILNSFLPIKYKYMTASVTQMTPYKNGYYVVPFMENEVYYATSNKCILKYRIKFNQHNKPDNFYDALHKIDEKDMRMVSQSKQKLWEILNQKGYIINIQNIFESSKFLYFQFVQNSNPIYSVIICKRNGHILVGALENDIDYGLVGTPLTMIGDTLVSVIYPYELLKRIEKLDNK